MSRLKNKLHEEINDEARKIEKITEEVKKKCIKEISRATLNMPCENDFDNGFHSATERAIKAITDVE